MKQKKILIILALALLFTGCANDNQKRLNENSAPEKINNYNESEVTGRLNNLKNGAAPKVKTDSQNNQNPNHQSYPAQKMYQEEIAINNSTKNMNNVLIETNKGEIKIKLNPEKAPLTVENFKRYANAGFFTNTIFHRVMPGFMIQGGGFTVDKEQKPTEQPIKIESDNGLKNNRGTVAMARTQDPNSATAQFFINLVDNDFLNFGSAADGYGYTVFGEVISGMEVVDEIAKVETGNNGPHQNWPVDDIIIEKVTLLED